MSRIVPFLVSSLVVTGAASAQPGLSAPAGSVSTRVTTPGVDVLSILAEVEPMISPCVQPTAGPGVFTLCFDWHSSVHAHWAAYRIARVDPTRNQIAEDSYLALTPAKLAWEQNNIPAFEMPYGRAWFLRLAIEFQHWARENGKPDPHRLRPMGNQVAMELIAHYNANTPTPLDHEYTNASWAFVQLHDYLELVGATVQLQLLEAKIQQHFLGAYPQLAWSGDQGYFGFFSRFGNWIYLHARTADDSDPGQLPAGPIRSSMGTSTSTESAPSTPTASAGAVRGRCGRWRYAPGTRCCARPTSPRGRSTSRSAWSGTSRSRGTSLRMITGCRSSSCTRSPRATRRAVEVDHGRRIPRV